MTKPAPIAPQRGFHARLPTFEGAAVADLGVLRAFVPVFGLLRARVRVQLVSGDGTFAVRFVQPNLDGTFPDDGTGLHTTGQPADLAVADTDEGVIEISDLFGEGYLMIQYTDAATAGGSVIDHVTVSAL